MYIIFILRYITLNLNIRSATTLVRARSTTREGGRGAAHGQMAARKTVSGGDKKVQLLSTFFGF